MSKLARFGVSLEASLLKDFDRLIRQKGYGSRSEAFRDLIRNALVEDEWSELKGEQAATLTLVYDHDFHEIGDRLTAMQHHHGDLVVCSTHVHLSEHMCLEVIVLRGDATQIRDVADHLLATRGVQHGKLIMTTLGRKR